jgi:hypothetical protein
LKLVRPILILAVIGALTFGVWWYFFPSPERAIKKRLNNLSELISADVAGSNIKRVANIHRIINYFASDVTIRADAVSRYSEVITGRDTLMQGLMGARTQFQRIEAKFYNIAVQVDPSGTNATVLLTALVRLNNQEDPFLGDAKVGMRKEDGKWLISSAAPIKTEFK